MKIKKILAVAFSLAFASFGFAKGYSPEVQENFKPNKYNRQNGYQFVENGEKVIFVFDTDYYKVKYPLKIFVEGTFNGWAKKNPSWQLAKYKGKVWTMECTADDIAVPGNSGFPEFKFVVTQDVPYTETVCGQTLERKKQETFEAKAISKIPGCKINDRCILVYPGVNCDELAESIKTADTVKKLKDFDLENPEDQEKIANFRLIPGTTKIFRGYNPTKISKKYDTEKSRLVMVNKLLRQNEIKSIITLSGNEQIDLKKETVSVYVGDIQSNNNQFFLRTLSDTVYHQSASSDFFDIISKTVDFINSHPGPYYITSRLGIDRTGVICAVFEALSGASWDDIKADYEKSNQMGIAEFRSHRLLQYSFEQMIGKPMNEVTDLQKEISELLLNNNTLTKSDLETFLSRVK